MRIFHVLESVGAGVMSAALAMADATPELEHHLVVWPRRSHDDNGDDASAAFAHAHHLPADLRAARRALRELVRDGQPDVVHAHSSFAGLLVRTTRLGAARVVYSPHCFGFERRDLRGSARVAARVVERVLARRTNLMVACSPHEAALASALGYGRVVTVPNRALHPPEVRAEAHQDARVVTVGRLGPQKDWRYLLEVRREFLRLEPAAPEWSWLGGGDDEAARVLAQHGIKVTGWLPRADVVRRLGSATTYVHTAEWEAAPVSILEAAAVGLPMAVRSIGSLASLDVPGLASTPRLQAEIMRSYQVPDEWDRAHRASLALADAHSVDAQRDRLLAAYESVLSTP